MELLFFFTNCEKENINTSNSSTVLSSSPSFTLKRIDNPPISENKALSDKIKSIVRQPMSFDSNIQLREVYNPELDFTIDTDVANYIEYGAYHSYTFLVNRAEENGLTENVLLSLQNDGTYLAYLVAYDITEEEKTQIQNNELINLDDKVTYTILQDQDWANTIFQRLGDNGVCHEWVTITPTCPYSGEHTAKDIENGANCSFDNQGYTVPQPYLVSSFIECPEDGGGGFNPTDPAGQIYDDYGNPIGGGGSSDGSSTNPNTNPDDNGNNDNPNDGSQAENEDCLQLDATGSCVGDMGGILIKGGTNDNEPDCQENIPGLTEIANTPEIKTELDRLKNNMGFATEEDGKRFIYTGANINDPNTYNDANFDEQLPIDADDSNLDFPPLQNNTLVGAHFHPAADINGKPIRKVPSGTDIAEHINMIKKVYATNPVAATQVTNFIISGGSGGITYVLRANNVFNIVNNTKNYNRKKNRTTIWEKVIEILKPINALDYTGHETAITNFLTDEFPYLDLLKAEYDSDGNITKFCKLKKQE
ncbi:hypothetical protein [Ichthyenterobacterium magnum]|uniref:Uncharacterized protein n=1 Tax=Ichthyenterobacterium magnum TaxID=1230530 RepID=A0A420DGM2_9FLAO|nr:hypothetical protein [Ichthyenterobacterium magnum]RKE92238.1 hypothetical protein BXY80_2156 [Ichthyenterobacterium magnum]